MIVVVGTLIWCGLAIYQVIQDARYRLLPWGPTVAAMGVGLLVGWHMHALGSGSVWWLWHVGAAMALTIVGMVLWFMGALGLGDVAVFGVFGLIFGLMGAVAIIALSYLAMTIVVLIRWARHQSTEDLPLGIPLWLLSIPVWCMMLLVATQGGGVI